MMPEFKQFSDQEQVEIEEGIERVFAFVQDVLDSPSVLDHLPHQAAILLTPIAEKDALVSYVAETRRFAISIDQPDSIPQHIHFA